MNIKDLIAFVRRGESFSERGRCSESIGIGASMPASEVARWKPHWKIEKYADDEAYKTGRPFEVLEFDGNLLLNEGINAIWTLVCGGGGIPFSNANARIGVGDSNAAEAATQIDLQAATNKLYKGMDPGYPQYGSNQKVVFRSTFGSNEANWAWNEITVDNGATAGINLNRKVQVMGTKASPATWVVTLEITLS